MTRSDELQTLYSEMEAGIVLAKCQKCGCMRETLDSMAALLPTIDGDEARTLLQQHAQWAAQMLPVQYTCLGCDHCYAGAAQNAFATVFPTAVSLVPLSCDFQVNQAAWPSVVGEYFVVDPTAPVAVSTLVSVELAEQLAQQKPQGLAIVGKTETENIGLDKVIKNIITNPAIRFLIVAGRESAGHGTGQTLIALAAKGVDAKGRVIGSTGKRPILRNVTADEVNAFRQQVQVVDLIGCESLDEISAHIEALLPEVATTCSFDSCAHPSAPFVISNVETITADEPEAIALDKSGYFVVVPQADRGVINVEHYDYDNTLLHIVEGQSGRALYATIIAKGWVSELSHAAYLGKELAKAELSLKYSFKYVQDGA